MKSGCWVHTTYQDNTTAPDVDLATSVERVAHDKLGRSIARASTASLHEIAATRLGVVEAHLSYEVLVAQPVLDLLAQLVLGVEGVGEPKVGDDDVLVAVQQQVLKLQISVYDTLLVQVAHTGYELGEQFTRGTVLQVAVVENVVEELTARCILEDDANVSLSLYHLVQPDDVGVVEPTQDVDLAIDLL